MQFSERRSKVLPLWRSRPIRQNMLGLPRWKAAWQERIWVDTVLTMEYCVHSGLPSSREIRSYWRESSEGPRKWLRDWSVSTLRKGWESSGKGGPEKLWSSHLENLSPRKYSETVWMWSWPSALGDPAWAGALDPMISRGLLQPKPFYGEKSFPFLIFLMVF